MEFRPKRRRTATALLAGDFDLCHPRNISTSGVGLYRKRKRASVAVSEKASRVSATTNEMDTSNTHPSTSSAATSLWCARPANHIATIPRSFSVIHPPMSSPSSIPKPSSTSSTSRTSSNRPHTLNNNEDFGCQPASSVQRKPQKKRVAVKKGGLRDHHLLASMGYLCCKKEGRGVARVSTPSVLEKTDR